jgi:uncharacterized peroxidase-related enzyme
MSFLTEPAPSEGQQKLYDADVAEDGFVWDQSRLWAHQPDLDEAFSALIVATGNAAGLSKREKAMLVIGQASTIGDSYCCVAWGRWLTEWEDAEIAAAALRGDEAAFNDRERALATWAHAVADHPNDTRAEDVEWLRTVGFADPEILALTLYAALRMALSSINDALGARPDQALIDMLEPAVRNAITWGRRPHE